MAQAGFLAPVDLVEHLVEHPVEGVVEGVVEVEGESLGGGVAGRGRQRVGLHQTARRASVMVGLRVPSQKGL
jgi:hypothetical protein